VAWGANGSGQVAVPSGVVDIGLIVAGEQSSFAAEACSSPGCDDADIFRDFNVNGADLGILLSQWGPSTLLTRSDLNRDGVVDGSDLGIFLSLLGTLPLLRPAAPEAVADGVTSMPGASRASLLRCLEIHALMASEREINMRTKP
jgi:hypothetical protein